LAEAWLKLLFFDPNMGGGEEEVVVGGDIARNEDDIDDTPPFVDFTRLSAKVMALVVDTALKVAPGGKGFIPAGITSFTVFSPNILDKVGLFSALWGEDGPLLTLLFGVLLVPLLAASKGGGLEGSRLTSILKLPLELVDLRGLEEGKLPSDSDLATTKEAEEDRLNLFSNLEPLRLIGEASWEEEEGDRWLFWDEVIPPPSSEALSIDEAEEEEEETRLSLEDKKGFGTWGRHLASRTLHSLLSNAAGRALMLPSSRLLSFTLSQAASVNDQA
jgi:hypothetical protein